MPAHQGLHPHSHPEKLCAKTFSFIGTPPNPFFVEVEQTALFWSFIGLAGCAVAFSCTLWTLAQRGAGKPGSPAMVRSRARVFHERVNHFTLQVRTLDEHANEYTSIFNSEDWDSLVQTVSKLEHVDQEVCDLLRAKRFDSVTSLLDEFQGKNNADLDSIQASLDSYQANRGWEEHVHGMLKRVVQNLEAATHETKELSRSVTSRKRQPTLVTLADVKKSLLEDEAIRRTTSKTSKL